MLRKLRKMLARKSATPTAGSSRPSAANRRFVPRLNGLEDRLAPATIMVTTRADVVNAGDGLVSLREAITLANSTAAADTIQLQGGIYRITLAGAGDNANATGDFDITKTTTIVGVGAQSTVIDGGRLDRVFHIEGTAPNSIRGVFQGLTIRNGRSTDDGGGGILIGNSDLIVRDSAITRNEGFPGGGGISNFGHAGTGNVTLLRTLVSHNIASAGNGGGIDLAGGTLTLTDSAVRRNVTGQPGDDTGGGFGGGFFAQNANLTNSTITGNTAFISGGGFYTSDSATVTGGAVANNTARSEGGGMYVFQTARLNGTNVRDNFSLSPTGFGGGLVTTNAFLTNCTVSGNTGGFGAGVAATTAFVTGTTISGNHATGAGGGLYSITTASVTNSTVSDNTAGGNGGGIRAGTLTMSNSTISGNSAGVNGVGSGGGVHAAHGSILNSTIVENFAAGGGGGLAWAGESDPIRVKNSIVALNLTLPISSGPDVRGTFVSDGNNLIGDAGGSNGFGSAGDQLGTFAAPLDPKLSALQNNGGPTLTHIPLKGSSAIDRGNNTGAPSLDQRGVARPRDGDFDTRPNVDIGAVER